jgi:hypothetical protein
VVDHLDFDSVDLSAGYEEATILADNFFSVAKIVEDIEDHIGERGNLLATFENKLVREERNTASGAKASTIAAMFRASMAIRNGDLRGDCWRVDIERSYMSD